MKICGIICEYNPFHNGHLRHLQYTKSHSDTIICVMSGDFTQRGSPAIIDKYTRAKHAILGGADMVIEIPVIYAVASAENFAFGGVQLLNALGCDSMSFGSESGNLDSIRQCAQLLVNPTEELTVLIKENISEGLSYPAAISKALSDTNPQLDILDKPNNMLAVEYMKQLILTKSSIQPITFQRPDNYNARDIIDKYASAGALRKIIGEQRFDELPKYMPDFVIPDANHTLYANYQIFAHSFMNTVSGEYLEKIEGVTEGLHNRIMSNARQDNFVSMVMSIKTKRYTLLKIQRVILNALLGITKDFVAYAKQTRPYARVLAIKKDRLDLLSYIARCNLPTPQRLLIEQKPLNDLDIKASNIYSSLSGQFGNRDLTNPLQKI